MGWKRETFIDAYAANRHEGHALALEISPISTPLIKLVSGGVWEGTSGQLLARLAEIAGAEVTSGRDWPKSPRALTEALKRLAPSLRAMGIDWERPARTGGARLHALRATPVETVTTGTTVAANADEGAGCIAEEVWDRQRDEWTVTSLGARDDGNDGADGPDPGELVDLSISVEDDDQHSAWDPNAGDDVDEQRELWSFASGSGQDSGAAP